MGSGTAQTVSVVERVYHVLRRNAHHHYRFGLGQWTSIVAILDHTSSLDEPWRGHFCRDRLAYVKYNGRTERAPGLYGGCFDHHTCGIDEPGPAERLLATVLSDSLGYGDRQSLRFRLCTTRRSP